MNISEFKKGDKVVRVEAAYSYTTTNPLTGLPETRGGDRSYMGEKLTFIGIANGCAYFDREEDCSMSKILETTRVDLRLDWWSEGWEYWIDIDSVEDENHQIKFNLKQEIENAIKNEDYELIAELKLILENSVK
jgi:hypothetical protein